MTLARSRVVVDGTDINETFGLVLTSDTDLGVAEPKTYVVDIPGGNGSIDLTEALTGDVAYEDRTMRLAFAADGVEDVERLRTRMLSMLHGRRLPFTLSFDPGYTYTGRFAVGSFERVGPAGVEVTVEVTCDPYKLKEHCAYRLNATGGVMFEFESGRRPVHPVIECEQPCFVTWDGVETTVPAGSYRLNDVVFREGRNRLYVNTQRLYLEDWAALGEGAAHATTWAAAASMRWDDVQRLGVTDGAPQSWAEVEGTCAWSDLGEGGADAHTWAQLDYRHDSAAMPDATAYLTYDWEDL